ncbi:MAG: N-acetyl sugar amidotransferase [Candidatus Pseudomonas colombiensis]|jgi:N-acetyl sugar amidotransferase|uniref:N-acetyl sugar amidotransferase n=1 Tax=Pseudomonas morbosilactucae TaxID=2938197 RepID=A0ABT0JLV4_9PSED|nr:N-acetyl sugar amidotransferase [Pseudomonas morbosilactucae]MCK9816899.1 N-acetyl sugar amidotransferase [Pseudomonas morbosilactucae]WEK10586.1 MAG: N-acetyl sugar amidotransferase [Pseudomonas sp.]
MVNKENRVCSRCVMDSSASAIVFDEAGVCNYCREFDRRVGGVVFAQEVDRAEQRKAFIEKVKRAGQGKQYDCIVGLSGGVDSSYVIHLALAEGLRPLAVHMDNNWNSELAVNNIKNLVTSLGVDLYTHVIDWPEYKGLMQAFFDSDVIDIELLYDNAMLAVNYEQARKYGIKYILSGSNAATEGMPMPEGWNWFKWDKRNIKAIGQRNNVKIKTFPIIGTLGFGYNRVVRRIQWAPFLDLYDYQKESALELLEEKYAYKRYPYKHYESVFTRFYQGFILPEKFSVDKRKLHFSALIMSGQMTREQAMSLLGDSPYASPEELERDRKYFLKKMGWSDGDLEAYLKRPEKPHDAYPSERALWDFVRKMYQYKRG